MNNSDRIFKNHILCFDTINFINRVGMPLVMIVINDLWLPTFLVSTALLPSILPIPPGIRPFNSNLPGSLNDKLHSSIHAVFRSYV